jgi:hypothetical protein
MEVAMKLTMSRRAFLRHSLLVPASALAPGYLRAADAEHHRHDGMHARSRPRAGLAAAAAVDAKGVLWSVHVQDGHVVLRKSDDYGATWLPPSVAVNGLPERIEIDGDSGPKIALAPTGEIYVTWTRPLAQPYTGEIRFARSTDGGRSFEAPKRVHADPRPITHRFDSLSVAHDGRVFVAWVDKRDMIAARGKKPAYAGAAIYYAVSDDRGRRFRGDFKVADHTCECCRIALLPQPDGSMRALWRHVFDADVRDHALADLHADGSVTAFRRATFDDWHIDACPHQGPSLATDSRARLHAVWYNGAPETAGVYYGRLANGRVEARRRVGGDTAEHADLAVADDRIAIAWKEFDGQQSLLRAMLSSDGGESYVVRDVAATADASDQPRMLVHDGRFFVFWNTRAEPLKVVELR